MFNEMFKKVVEVDVSSEMKVPTFAVAVGNPPYQTGEGISIMAVYHLFDKISKKFSETVSLVYPAKWMLTGKGVGLTDFRRDELESRHYSKYVVYSGDFEVFGPKAKIRGGVNTYLWKFDYHGPVSYIFEQVLRERFNLLDGMPEMIRDNRYLEIAEKVDAKNLIKIESSSFYGKFLATESNIKKIDEGFLSTGSVGNEFKGFSDSEMVKVYYSGRERGVSVANVPKSLIQQETDDYKVFLSKTATDLTAGNNLRRLWRVFVGDKGTACSGSFSKLGSFKTRSEAENCVLFLKTDLMTFLFGLLTATQHASKRMFRLIPEVDFATGQIEDSSNFLNFRKLETLDEQLAGFYGLTEAERNLMKRSIKPWRDKFSVEADGLY